MGIAKFLLNTDNEIIDERLTATEKFGELMSKVKELKPTLATLEDRVINNLLTICSRDKRVAKDAITAEDLVAWMDDYGTIGELIFSVKNELALKNLEDLAMIDPKFMSAVRTYGKKYNYIGQDGKDLTSEEGKILSDKELLRAIIDDACRSSTEAERETNTDHFDEELFNTTMDIIEEIYDTNQLNEVMEETTITEDVTVAKEHETPTNVEPEVENGVTPSMANTRNTLLVTDLINSSWNYISAINGTIATIEYENHPNKSEIINILNDIIDQTTINIGMLYKVSAMVDSKTAELIEVGQEKAEEKVAE